MLAPDHSNIYIYILIRASRLSEALEKFKKSICALREILIEMVTDEMIKNIINFSQPSPNRSMLWDVDQSNLQFISK